MQTSNLLAGNDEQTSRKSLSNLRLPARLFISRGLKRAEDTVSLSYTSVWVDISILRLFFLLTNREGIGVLRRTVILDMRPASAAGLAEVILIWLPDSRDDTDANMGQTSRKDYCAGETWEKTGFYLFFSSRIHFDEIWRKMF